VGELLRARGLVDLIIPRGGAGLISYVVENATVPVIETGVGNVHVYVDAAADLDMAERIVVNAKTSRPSVCNAAETLLVHRAVADEFVPRIVRALAASGVTLHGDAAFTAAGATPATDDDWAAEYLSLDLAARVSRAWTTRSPISGAVLRAHRGDRHRDLDTARRFVAGWTPPRSW